MEIETCEDYAQMARRMVGFTYAQRFQNRLFGQAPITLEDARKKGEDLKFASTWEFVEENHLPGRFGLTEEEGDKIYDHVSNCSSDVCQDAKERLKSLTRFFQELDKDGGGDLGWLLIFSAINGKIMPLTLKKKDSSGNAIDLLIPIFELYTDYRSDFVWPGEGRIRFEGSPYVHFNSNNGDNGIHFANSKRDPKRTIDVPYDLVRKLRYQGSQLEEGRDIWRNPEVYHVHMSHPNRESYDKQWGTMALELREDRDEKEIEDMSGRIIEADVGLRRLQQ